MRRNVRPEDVMGEGRAVSAMLSRSLPCSGGMTRKVSVTGVRRVLNSGKRDRNSSSRSRISLAKSSASRWPWAVRAAAA